MVDSPFENSLLGNPFPHCHCHRVSSKHLCDSIKAEKERVLRSSLYSAVWLLPNWIQRRYLLLGDHSSEPEENSNHHRNCVSPSIKSANQGNAKFFIINLGFHRSCYTFFIHKSFQGCATISRQSILQS